MARRETPRRAVRPITDPQPLPLSRPGKAECFDRVGLLGRRYYFRLRAGNGEIVLASEGYNSAAARDHGLEVARLLLAAAPRVDL